MVYLQLQTHNCSQPTKITMPRRSRITVVETDYTPKRNRSTRPRIIVEETDYTPSDAVQSAQKVIMKFTHDFILEKGWTEKSQLDAWCLENGATEKKDGTVLKKPLYLAINRLCPLEWGRCVSRKTKRNYSSASVRYAFQPLLQGYAYCV